MDNIGAQDGMPSTIHGGGVTIEMQLRHSATVAIGAHVLVGGVGVDGAGDLAAMIG